MHTEYSLFYLRHLGYVFWVFVYILFCCYNIEYRSSIFSLRRFEIGILTFFWRTYHSLCLVGRWQWATANSSTVNSDFILQHWPKCWMLIVLSFSRLTTVLIKIGRDSIILRLILLFLLHSVLFYRALIMCLIDGRLNSKKIKEKDQAGSVVGSSSSQFSTALLFFTRLTDFVAT